MQRYRGDARRDGAGAHAAGYRPRRMIRVGTSGRSYDHWTGVPYPHGAAPRQRLDLYAPRFDTVEVNSTFYR